MMIVGCNITMMLSFLLLISDFLADFGFARFLPGEMMAATLCGSPMYMVGSQRILWVWMRGRECLI